MTERPTAPSHSAAPQRCPSCGYDLRGSASPVCPECGTPKTWRRLRFFNREQYLDVLKALSDADVAHRGIDGGGGLAVLGQIYMGTNVDREIWIGEPDAERAIEALESAGIGVPMPIVDRAEPACPSCNTTLDSKGPASCSACGTIFQWVEISEPDIDSTGLHCDQCDYDLTGNASDRCPECGALIPKDLDALVAAATEDEPAPSDTQDTPTPSSPTRSVVSIMMGGAFIVGVTSVGITIARTANPYLFLMIVAVAIGIAIGAVACVKYLRHRTTR